MKRNLFSLLLAVILLLPAVTTAASPGFVCDACDYESSAAGQREVTVAKDGGTVKIREYFCPNCKSVVGSVEIPGSYQRTPAEDPEENKPSPSSGESQEPGPSRPAEDPSAGDPAIPSGTGSSSAAEIPAAVIPVSPAANDDPPKNPASSNSQNAPVNVQPEQPAAGAGASTVVVPEQPAASAGTTGTGIVYPETAGSEHSSVVIRPEQPAANTGTADTAPAGTGSSAVIVRPEQPVTNTGTADTAPAGTGNSAVIVRPEQPVTNAGTADTAQAGSGNSAVIVRPEQPVTNAGTNNTGTQSPEGSAPIVLVPLNPSPASGVPSGASPVGIPPEQPVTQTGTYADPAPAAEREPVRAEPEYPVSPIMDQQSSSNPPEADAPVVLVTEKPPVSAEVTGPVRTQPELTVPPAPEQTLPPVIREDPTFTPLPTAAPTETLKPNFSRTSPPAFAEDKYPVFSRFFPARRLHLKGDPEARAPRAGVKIWPEEPGMSLLDRMLNSGNHKEKRAAKANVI